MSEEEEDILSREEEDFWSRAEEEWEEERLLLPPEGLDEDFEEEEVRLSDLGGAMLEGRRAGARGFL